MNADSASQLRSNAARTAILLLTLWSATGCVSNHRGTNRMLLPAHESHDSHYVVTIVAQAKYFLSQIPPRLVWSELYGDEEAVTISGETNVKGVIMEILEPKEYAGQIYTLRDKPLSQPLRQTILLGSIYEFRGSRREIGKLSFQASPPPRLHRLNPEETKTKLEKKAAPRIDDLKWLVGRWRCITREWLTSFDDGPLGLACEDALEYFNVYFPFADDHLTLQLTDNPEDRPIAAEFLARRILPAYHSREFEERLVPMMEPGPVRISKDHILVGYPFGTVEFRYARREGRNGPLLILESKFMRLEFYKLESTLRNIKDSSVHAPIKDCSAEQIARLQTEYEELARGTREKMK